MIRVTANNCAAKRAVEMDFILRFMESGNFSIRYRLA